MKASGICGCWSPSCKRRNVWKNMYVCMNASVKCRTILEENGEKIGKKQTKTRKEGNTHVKNDSIRIIVVHDMDFPRVFVITPFRQPGANKRPFRIFDFRFRRSDWIFRFHRSRRDWFNLLRLLECGVPTSLCRLQFLFELFFCRFNIALIQNKRSETLPFGGRFFNEDGSEEVLNRSILALWSFWSLYFFEKIHSSPKTCCDVGFLLFSMICCQNGCNIPSVRGINNKFGIILDPRKF